MKNDNKKSEMPFVFDTFKDTNFLKNDFHTFKSSRKYEIESQ